MKCDCSSNIEKLNWKVLLPLSSHFYIYIYRICFTEVVNVVAGLGTFLIGV